MADTLRLAPDSEISHECRAADVASASSTQLRNLIKERFPGDSLAGSA